jgi:CheY-like chemotaxis protein
VDSFREADVNAEPPHDLHQNPRTLLPHDNGSGLHILVVEDDRDTAASTAYLLRSYGYRVQVASDGPSACQAARGNPPDVVLLDLALPGMDGWEVSRRMQEQTGEKKPFLIAVTGYGAEADRRRSRENGIHLHLVKPVDPGFLQQVLGRFSRIFLPTDA